MVQCPECGHSVPEGKTTCLYCGVDVKGVAPSLSVEETPEIGAPDWMLKLKEPSGQDLVITFGLKKSKKRRPMGKLALMIIFMGSFVLGGFLVWLLR